MYLRRILQFNLVVSALIAVMFVLFAGPTLALYGIANVAATADSPNTSGPRTLPSLNGNRFALRSGERSFIWGVVVSFFWAKWPAQQSCSLSSCAASRMPWVGG